MAPELKEKLYNELMSILIKMEEKDNKGALTDLETLINVIKFDQL